MNEINHLIDKIFPSNYPIVFLHAHPDDESFLSAGLLNKLVTKNRKCVVVFTAAAIVDGQERTFIRQKEAVDACCVLGINSVFYLKFCESKYSEKTALPLMHQDIERVTDNLFETLNKNDIYIPFILVSYDKNGGYGNIDHKIIHAIGQDFQRKYKNLVPFLFEITINRDKVFNWLSDAKNRLTPQSIPKLSYWSFEFGLPYNEITYYYQLTEEQLVLKRKALSMHKSQISPNEFPLSLSDDDFNKLFGSEFLKFNGKF